MSDIAAIDQSILTSDERTMGTLAHVLQLVGGWIAPLVIFLVYRKSRFVSFHALQALLFQALYFFLSMIMMAAFFIVMMVNIVHRPMGQHNSLPTAFLIVFPGIWLGMMCLWMFILAVAIVYGIKAGRGEWAEYPVLGTLARRILKIGPGGGSLV